MFHYPKAKYLEHLHKRIIKLGLDDGKGGKYGYDGEYTIENLKSVIYFIGNDLYYETFEEKLTHLFFSINKDHFFADGNKRSSVYFGAYFININWFHSAFKNKYFTDESYFLFKKYGNDEKECEKHYKALVERFTNKLVIKFIEEMENITVDVAKNKIDKDLLQKIITSLVYEDDYSEELKIEIYNSINNR